MISLKAMEIGYFVASKDIIPNIIPGNCEKRNNYSERFEINTSLSL